MSADFWAGYISGAAGIIIGNPLDLVKTRLQAGGGANSPDAAASPTCSTANATPQPQSQSFRRHFDRAGTLVRGSTAPILTYGALNALLFTTYNRTLSLLSSTTANPHLDPSFPPTLPTYPHIFAAGAIGGLATFIVSAPTELIKCRAQVSRRESVSSWGIAREVWRTEGIRGLYYGGGITSVRDAVGYGFYFWSYEWAKRSVTAPDDTDGQTAMKVLLCGGFAGIVTWASIFPLDVIKTRVQTQELHAFAGAGSGSGADGEREALLQNRRKRLSTFQVAREAYRSEGTRVFFRGLGICSVRAFVVNAVQWAVYEWMMRLLQQH